MKLALNRELVTRRQAFAAERTFIDLAKANAPEWAKGCDKCKFGVIGAEYSNSPLPLYQAQPLLAEAGLIRFCDCQAGRTARERAKVEYLSIRDNPYTAFMRRQLEAWVESHNTPTVHAEVAA